MAEVPYDTLWKEIISELFEDFLLFYFLVFYEEIVFSTHQSFSNKNYKSYIPSRSRKNLLKFKLKMEITLEIARNFHLTLSRERTIRESC